MHTNYSLKLSRKRLKRAVLVPLAGLSLALVQVQAAEKPLEDRVAALEKQIAVLVGEVQNLRSERDAALDRARAAEDRANEVAEVQNALLAEVSDMRENGVGSGGGSGIPEGFKLGAYGEHHFNFVEGAGDQSDIHRFVIFAGYDFADWISLTTETEIEHAFVNSSDGDLVIEQFYVDLRYDPALNFRLGRALHPAGIVNRFHEPTSFFGVERPTFSSRILPSTWSIDGVGLWGSLTDWLDYEVYLHGGLDGSGFSAGSGIRGGRMKERPGLGDPGVSGRIDIDPFAMSNSSPEHTNWRIGASGGTIGTQNGDQGNRAGKPDGRVNIFALDSDLSVYDWKFRGEIAWLDNSAADNLANGTSEEIFGWYLEAAYPILPDSMKSGNLEESELFAFVRYSDINTQEDVPNAPENKNLNTGETTLGVSFYPVHNFVLKADYTFVDPETGAGNNRFDLGFGYDF